MYTISKQFNFSASHQLAGLPDTHPCSRLHGHNYRVELVLALTQVNDVGFVMDYRELDEFKKWLDETVDHRHLNDLVGFNPTAELLARWFYLEYNAQQLQKHKTSYLVTVRVSETDKTWAEYRP